MVAVKIESNFKLQNRAHSGKFFNKQATRLAETAANFASKVYALEQFKKTVITWNDPPIFTARHTQKGWSIHVSDKKWIYLDKGTKVRYATMTKNFVPKTKVGVFYSYQGAGKVAYVRKKKPRPGIKARGWSEKVDDGVGKIIRKVYREKLHANWIQTK